METFKKCHKGKNFKKGVLCHINILHWKKLLLDYWNTILTEKLLF